METKRQEEKVQIRKQRPLQKLWVLPQFSELLTGHKGLRQGQHPWILSPAVELLGAPSTLRPRAAVGCLVSGTFCFLPVLSLSSPKRTKDLDGRDTFL